MFHSLFDVRTYRRLAQSKEIADRLRVEFLNFLCKGFILEMNSHIKQKI